jgi:hypothetical protein
MSAMIPPQVQVLFRDSLAEEGELQVCEKYFNTTQYRTNLLRGSLVIPRYAALPYHKELEIDVTNMGCRLINTTQQHNWIANFDWYNDLEEFTPKTWFDHNFYRCDDEGPFVVKGRTNSRKFQWNTMMYAKNKKDASNIAGDLCQDGLIGEQGIVYRKYIPLKTYEYGINGLPFTNEWRFFCFRDQILSYGYYWSIAEKLDDVIDLQGVIFTKEIIQIIANLNRVNFYVLDVAEKEEGGWVLIEINDGSMSGLSENSPEHLYGNLKKCLVDYQG